MSLRDSIKKKLFAFLGKDPDAVVVTFLTGDPDLSAAMAAEVRRLLPDRRHFTIGMQGAPQADIVLKAGSTLHLYGQLKARLGSYRIGMAPVLFTRQSAFSPLRRAAFLLAPGKILAYNPRLERHHLQLRSLLSSLLFLRGVPLDRIHLRPRWLAPWKRDRSNYPRTTIECPGRPLSPKRRRIAILTPYLPWPLSHGGAVRIYNLLRQIAPFFDVFLFSFRDQESAETCAPLLDLCARVILVDKPRYREPRWSTLLPPEVREFQSPTMRRLWRDLCRAHDIPLRQIEYTALAPYGGDILVEHDVTFDLFTQVHAGTRTLSSWWDLFRWRLFEHRVVRNFQRVVVMSDKDAALLSSARTAIIPNGVDLDRFRPKAEMPGYRLLFIGSFRHFPNILAFRYFTESVWPLLRSLFPEITLTVVAGPDPLLYWSQHTGAPAPPAGPGLTLLGFVSDVRPLYNDANVVIVPTTVSAGTNLKVLEAMAMDRAIVSTPSGCAGLGLVHNETAWIAPDATSFAQGIAALLSNPILRLQMAAAARKHVETHYGWNHLGRLQIGLYDELLPPLIAIRDATLNDVPALAAIQNECAEASHWAPERYLVYRCRVALYNREVAGFLVSRETAPGEREILNLAVAHRHRRAAVGTALLRDEIAFSSGAYFLEVRESNLAAQALYRSVGFEPVGTRGGYYDDPPEAALVMRLQRL